MKGSRLIRDSEIAIELLELTAQSGEVARQRRGIADIVVGAKEAIEGCFDERRFCGAGTFGRFCQPRGHAFGEIDANSGFHEGYLLWSDSRAVISGANERTPASAVSDRRGRANRPDSVSTASEVRDNLRFPENRDASCHVRRR